MDDLIDALEWPSFWQLISGLLVGAVFITMSIPSALVRIGQRLSWPWLSATGTLGNGVLDQVSGSTASSRYLSFGYLWSILVVGLLVYLGALAVLALRHGRIDLFFAGALTLVIGTAILHLLAWVVYLFILLVVFIAFLVALLFEFLGFIFAAIFGFLAYILGFVFAFLALVFGFLRGVLLAIWAFLISSPLWIVVALVALGLLVYAAIRYRGAFVALIKALFWTGLVIGALFLVGWLIIVLAPVWAFLARVFAAIFQFLGVIFRFVFFILGYVVIGLVVGFVVYGIGAWVIDLFRGAWKSGNDTRGVIIGALAIGTALAFILLETNLYQLNAFPYFPIQALVAIQIFHQVSPIFDLIVALLVVGVSILGIMRNLGQLQEEPDMEEFQSAMVMAALGLFIVGGLLVIGSLAGGQSQS